MNNQELGLAVVAAIFFGIYPFLIRASGANYLVAGTVLQIGTAIIFLPLLAKSGQKFPNMLGTVSLLLLAAGIMNGLGHLAFQPLLARKALAHNADISRIIVVVVVAQIVVAMAGGLVIDKEPFTPKKFFGIVTAIIAVYFLKS